MRELSIKQQVALFCYKQDRWMNLTEIAERLHLSQQQVWSALNRILNDYRFDADVKPMTNTSDTPRSIVNCYRVFAIGIQPQKPDVYVKQKQAEPAEPVMCMLPCDGDVQHLLTKHNPMQLLLSTKRWMALS